MNTVKEIFNTLDQSQKDTLMIAFNDCLDQIIVLEIIVLENGTFIGCNLENTEGLNIVERLDNGWVCGSLKNA
jgi:hypothetical protein